MKNIYSKKNMVQNFVMRLCNGLDFNTVFCGIGKLGQNRLYRSIFLL